MAVKITAGEVVERVAACAEPLGGFGGRDPGPLGDERDELVGAARAAAPAPDAAGAVEAALEAIERELAAGGEVSITGFGKFSVAERAARQARNPQTGEPIEAAGRSARFSAGAKLKQAVAS